MTVDADTSTNDMITIMASGQSGVSIPASGPGYEAFAEALENVCLRLAKSVARDGEGATKLVAVTVTGAETEQDAELAARTIADSPLVKTALFGNDPNWGRILMAAGRSGANLDPSKLRVDLGDIRVCQDGGAIPFDRDAAHDYLTQKDVEIKVDLGVGSATATMWTCDFSYDYVKINAEYHT
jgi:glutamate N-acetyltransferase/amino-acid N-acetyltransferase